MWKDIAISLVVLLGWIMIGADLENKINIETQNMTNRGFIKISDEIYRYIMFIPKFINIIFFFIYTLIIYAIASYAAGNIFESQIVAIIAAYILSFFVAFIIGAITEPARLIVIFLIIWIYAKLFRAVPTNGRTDAESNGYIVSGVVGSVSNKIDNMYKPEDFEKLSDSDADQITKINGFFRNKAKIRLIAIRNFMKENESSEKNEDQLINELEIMLYEKNLNENNFERFLKFIGISSYKGIIFNIIVFFYVYEIITLSQGNPLHVHI